MDSDWNKTRLGDVFVLGPQRDIRRGQITPFVPMEALREGDREISRVDERVFTGSGTRFQNGDTLLARITPCLENGKTAFVSSLPEGIIAHGSTEYVVITGKPGISDNLFAYYVARLPEFRAYAIAHMEGTSGRQRVSSDAISRYEFALPPLPEQLAIAHVLGTLDDKIELNRRMNETLEEIARSLFRSWFIDFDPVRAKAEGREPAGMDAETAALFPDAFVDSDLGPIPAGWVSRTLADICSTQYGHTASATTEPVGPHFLRVMDINKRDWIDWSTVPYCSVTDSERSKYRLKPGDIVVARMADPGKSAIIDVDIDAVFASYLVRLKTDSIAQSHFVYGFLKSNRYHEYVQGAKGGSVQSNMNAKVIIGARLSLPEEPVLAAYLNLVAPLRTRVATNVSQTGTLVALRDTLLPKLLSGELRVPDAERMVEGVV